MKTLCITTTIEQRPDEEPCLWTHLLVDDAPIVELAPSALGISWQALFDSLKGSGEYFIITVILNKVLLTRSKNSKV